ncbi:MAG: glycoside hydrolase family 13 domain protein [Gemmatimonadetes bacterium]|nr:glycoside hydrolase family 13 domain protein [Gemmatimonadota bacterium]
MQGRVLLALLVTLPLSRVQGQRLDVALGSAVGTPRFGAPAGAGLDRSISARLAGLQGPSRRVAVSWSGSLDYTPAATRAQREALGAIRLLAGTGRRGFSLDVDAGARRGPQSRSDLGVGASAWQRRGHFLLSYSLAQRITPWQASAPGAQRGDTAISIFSDTLVRGPDTILSHPVTPPTQSSRASEGSRLRSTTEATTRLFWSSERFTALASVGWATTVGQRTGRPWASLGATATVGTRVALVGSLSSRPPDFGVGGRSIRRAQLGLRVSRSRVSESLVPPELLLAPLAFVLEGDSSARRITIRVSARERVELAGDFTQWEPVFLERGVQGARGSGDDAWTAVLSLPPGTHRVSIRVDGGAWLPAPGLPVTLDDFGGRVALLVVP